MCHRSYYKNIYMRGVVLYRRNFKVKQVKGEERGVDQRVACSRKVKGEKVKGDGAVLSTRHLLVKVKGGLVEGAEGEGGCLWCIERHRVCGRHLRSQR